MINAMTFVEPLGKVLSAHKKATALSVAAGSTIAFNIVSQAAGETGLAAVQKSIEDQMGTIVSTSLLVLGGVAAAAITLFGGIYVWKYGKKLFKVISS